MTHNDGSILGLGYLSDQFQRRRGLIGAFAIDLWLTGLKCNGSVGPCGNLGCRWCVCVCDQIRLSSTLSLFSTMRNRLIGYSLGAQQIF